MWCFSDDYDDDTGWWRYQDWKVNNEDDNLIRQWRVLSWECVTLLSVPYSPKPSTVMSPPLPSSSGNIGRWRSISETSTLIKIVSLLKIKSRGWEMWTGWELHLRLSCNLLRNSTFASELGLKLYLMKLGQNPKHINLSVIWWKNIMILVDICNYQGQWDFSADNWVTRVLWVTAERRSGGYSPHPLFIMTIII